MRAQDGEVKHFNIEAVRGITVLEALIHVYRNEDATLGFRYSCTVGRCYSCLMRMNGHTIVSCREVLVDGAVLEPMLNRAAIRDLATEDPLLKPSRNIKDKLQP